MHSTNERRARFILTTGLVSGVALVLLAGSGANAADPPTAIDLRTAGAFSVLGASAVTNTGPSVLNGDLGLSPETSITGFPPGIVNGATHATDPVAALAQNHLASAYGTAAGLTPTVSGLGDLAGLSLTPGIYSGGELSLTGTLTLAGSAESVWVFQADSTLITASASKIVLSGGASVCNVFWQVGSSATLGGGSSFTGTVMAADSISVGSAVAVTGRLLAESGAVTLINDTITAPSGCGPSVISPVFTSSSTAPDATAGTPYEFGVTATGSPAPGYTVASGSLPPGLTFDSATGSISGTPTGTGTSTVTIVAANGTGPDATQELTIEVQPAVVTPPGGGTGGSGTGTGTGTGGTGTGTGTGTDGAGTGTGTGGTTGQAAGTTTRTGASGATGALAATGGPSFPPLVAVAAPLLVLAGVVALRSRRRSA